MTIRVGATALTTTVIVLWASVASSQTPPPSERVDPDVFRVQIWGYIAADFTTRVESYMALRNKLEQGLPVLRVTDDPAEILSAQRALARRIRVARDGAKEGDIFTPAVSTQFRNVLAFNTDPDSLEVIMDDNPGDVSHHINETYPRGEPFSTVPAHLLAILPKLPDDLQYRFLGRRLILLDTRANVILDRIPCAIRCTH